MENIKPNYFYHISDEYFDKYNKHNDPEITQNKDSRRPYYYAIKVKNQKDLYFLIPLSSQIEKYEKIIESREKRGLPNDTIHIAKVAGSKSAFLLNKMIPVPAKYITSEKKYYGVPVKLVSNPTIRAIEEKAKRIVLLTNTNAKIPYQPDIKKLLSEISKDLQQEKHIAKETVESKEEKTIEPPKKESPDHGQSPKL